MTGRDVGTEIVAALPVTLSVVLLAFAIALVFAGIGVLAALKPGGIFDRASRFLAVLGLSIPAFWLGIVLIRVFAVDLRWLPPGGYAPASAGSEPIFRASRCRPSRSRSITSRSRRMTQASLQETLRGDYVRTARAMGLSPGRVVLYALVNALPRS